MKTVYIASPYTKGDVAMNVRNSFLVADELVSLGFLPYAPLWTHFWHFLSPHTHDFWTKLDLEWVLKCDCVLRLPGESSGADAEVRFAIKNGMPVFYSIEELRNYQWAYESALERNLEKEKQVLQVLKGDSQLDFLDFLDLQPTGDKMEDCWPLGQMPNWETKENEGSV